MPEVNQLPLQLKYRPLNWEDVLGNRGIVNSLRGLVEYDSNIPQVYLFSGPKGCGKTTIARILAMAVGCNVDSGDFKEYNSANTRGIETSRDIIENARYAPTSGSAKVYLLDEFHRGTVDAQNSLLKLAEDTPPNVYIMICTTEPGKLIEPLRDRCTSYQVETPTRANIITLLRGVVRTEQATVPETVLAEIEKCCGGSYRQALVLLGKVIRMQNEAEQLQIIQATVPDEAKTIDLCRALTGSVRNGGATKWGTVVPLLKGLRDGEPEQIRYAILGYLKTVLYNTGEDWCCDMITLFMESFMYSGHAGLAAACFLACKIR